MERTHPIEEAVQWDCATTKHFSLYLSKTTGQPQTPSCLLMTPSIPTDNAAQRFTPQSTVETSILLQRKAFGAGAG